MGTHLRVLSKRYPMNTNMTGIRWFFKNLCDLVLCTKVAFQIQETDTQKSSIFPIVELRSKLSDHVPTPDEYWMKLPYKSKKQVLKRLWPNEH